MQVFGAYFDISQAAQTPTGPFGLSILIWGVIIFTIVSISVITQLWWHIHKTESSYAYALSFDGISLEVKPNTLEIQTIMQLSNTLDLPLEYRFDVDKTYVKIDGETSKKLEHGNAGAVIPRLKPEQRFLPKLHHPNSYPCQGNIHCELLYGAPGKLSFWQKKEWDLELVLDSERNLVTTFTIKHEEDKPLKKLASHKVDYQI